MLIKASLLSLTLAASTGHTVWPIAQGNHLQPIQQQVEITKNSGVRQHARGAQSDVDALYEAIMRASAPRASNR